MCNNKHIDGMQVKMEMTSVFYFAINARQYI